MNKHVLRGAQSSALLIIALGSAAALSQTVGVNAAVKNIVSVKPDATAAERAARLKDRVVQGNDFTTASNSRLQILLLDQSSLTIGPNARLKIDRFVYDANRKASAVGASIAKGAFRFLSGKATHANPGQSAITTPIASIGIRGTMIEGFVGEEAVAIARKERGLRVPSNVDPKTATLVVLRGPGPRAVASERQGSIDVTAANRIVTATTPGQAVFVPGPGLAPIGPFALSNQGYQAFDAALHTVPTLTPPAGQSGRGRINSGESGSGPNLSTSLGLGLGIAGLGGLIAIISDGNNRASNNQDRPTSP